MSILTLDHTGGCPHGAGFSGWGSRPAMLADRFADILVLLGRGDGASGATLSVKVS